MLILLPPSEGKSAPRSGRPVDLGALALPALSPARDQVLDALVALCADDPDKAATTLGLSGGLRHEVAGNASLRTAPTAAAGRIYSGVLFEALGLSSLTPPARRWLNRSALVFSGLWGVVRLTDRVPAYRCPIGGNLPGIGALTRFWRGVLPSALAEVVDGDLGLDLRSGAYAATWTPPPARTVVVRVLHERVVDGVPTRSVVSHFNKATKGRLVRDLAEAGLRPRSRNALLDALRDLGYRVEVPTEGGPVDLVVTQL